MTRKLLKIALVVLLSVVSISIDAQEKPMKNMIANEPTPIFIIPVT